MKTDLANKEYYIGLDCGTSSVGYAVTDTDYNLLRFNGKDMWGSHLFEEAKTAKERRQHRCARRNHRREVQRLKLLQEIFAEEIYKVDPTFFIRLNDSKYIAEDKHFNDRNALFNDKGYTDRDYFKQFPTAYHLRSYLIKNGTDDPRLLYLAIHHILKHRGHFLFPGENMKSISSTIEIVEELVRIFPEIFEQQDLYIESIENFEDALKEKSKAEKKKKLESCISLDDQKLKKTLISLLMGYKIKTDALFNNEDYSDLPAIEFKKAKFEEDLPLIEDGLDDEEFKLVVCLKGLYDWALFADIMKGHVYLSDAKIALYEQNKNDLAVLKRVAKRYLTKEEYEAFFHSEKMFSAYIGKCHGPKGRKARIKKTSVDDFYKEVKDILAKCDSSDTDVCYLKEAIENESFFPLLMSFRNGVIPYQVNKFELEAILKKAESSFPFLSNVDEEGYKNRDKIVSLLTFRIPYYVGPLGNNANPNQKFGWLERRESGRILPWNLEKKVDTESSAENFILRMTNKCTYFRDEDVLPKNSISYQKYLVLSELNNLRIMGDRLDVSLKQKIFEDLFKNTRKVTINRVRDYLIKEGIYPRTLKKEDITGIDEDFKSSFGTYLDFKEQIESGKLKSADVDLIVKWITLFPEGGDILRNRIRNHFGTVLSSEEITRICKLKYAGWGRFSHKFLYEIQATNYDTGEMMSIVRMMWNTQFNLMELLSKDFEYAEQITPKNRIDKLDYSYIDELYVSPSVKRQIWQTMRIVDEIVRIMKHPPKKVFIETTRSHQEKKRTVSRRDDLISKLKEAKNDKDGYRDLFSAMESLIDNRTESEISIQDKLYLYFTQCGRCMYTGKEINIEDIYNVEIYDIDHIYPYSQSNDDSLTNRVLVCSTSNRKKSNVYPIDDETRNRMKPFWDMLKSRKFISEEKYKRLTRTSPLTEEELNGFIKRQLVETSQSTKASAEILKRFFGPETRIVYSKARNVSDFRKKFDFIKCRSLNDLHHAKDAYLNIVVGNVYDSKYTEEFYRFAKGKGYSNITKTFDFDVNGAWKVGDKGTILNVTRVMKKNNILVTKQPATRSGELYDLQLVKKGSKQGALPSKTSDERIQKMLEEGIPQEEAFDIWTSKYGGYNRLSSAYFAVVKTVKKNKASAVFVPISMIDAKKLSTEAALIDYCQTKLKLTNVEVICKKFLMNSVLKLDGVRFIITGKTSLGKQVTMSSMVPLIISPDSMQTLKKIESFTKKLSEFKDIEVDSTHDQLDDNNLLSLFDELVAKTYQPIYSNRPGNQNELLQSEATREIYISLSLNDKCKVINELMKYFGMGPGICNLVAIKGTKACGMLTKGSSIDLTKTKLELIFPSITGLFEKRIKLS